VNGCKPIVPKRLARNELKIIAWSDLIFHLESAVSPSDYFARRSKNPIEVRKKISEEITALLEIAIFLLFET